MVPAIATRICRVTVFGRGARVTRVGELATGVGERIKITGLPLALNERSLAVRLEGARLGFRLDLGKRAKRRAVGSENSGTVGMSRQQTVPGGEDG